MPRVSPDVLQYQNTLVTNLEGIFGNNQVKKEWDVASGSQDAYNRTLYCPILDIAVGPYNVDAQVDSNVNNIRNKLSEMEPFIRQLLGKSDQATMNYNSFIHEINKNPRCMLAIEIERSESAKHMLGNYTNVSILGAIGFVIPFNNKILTLCQRLRRYVKFATTFKKISRVFNNVLIIKKEAFFEIAVDYNNR